MNTDETPVGVAREIADGVFWLGGCQYVNFHGEELHGHMSTFLIVGDDRSLLVDTGHPAHWEGVKDCLDSILKERPLDYVLPTHPEMPHAGNIARLMTRYPSLQAVGDVRDYHLYYPELSAADRFSSRRPGEIVLLGGRSFVVLEAILRDLPNTVWGYDDATKTLFVSDGFGYSHHHMRNECRLTSSERADPPSMQQIISTNEQTLVWTKYRDTSRYWPRMERMLATYPVDLIAPAHGGVIDDPSEMVPKVRRALETIRRDELARQQS